MNAKKIFLLSYDVYLFSGIKAWLPNLVLVDAQVHASITPQYSSCLLIIDNRLPLLLVREWLHRNGVHFINMNCIVIRMSDARSVNHGYEDFAFINGSESSEYLISRIQKKLLVPAATMGAAKMSPAFPFRLTEFETEMLHASFSKEKLHEFCIANSITTKSIYRHRDKITSRFGFSHFHETFIFLTRNNFLHPGNSASNHVDKKINPAESPDISATNRLSIAIRNEEITPYFQPIVNSEGRICGVEVLARWPQEHHYAISQAEFIHLAEENGLVNELTNYLMVGVARSLVAGGIGINKDFFVSFNISPSTLSNPVFYWECLNFMDAMQKSPIKLMIEITDSQTLNITPAIKSIIRSLRNKGVLFALDDFGTGSANLCYLNELELDVIKIGQTFIKGIKEAEQHIPMLESMIRLAEILGLRTVAEGVEYEYQQQWLEKRDVDYMQGYQFLPPVAFNDFAHYYTQFNGLVQSAAQEIQ